jgi:glycosyltransferase involved in cell wall biosynthesis
MPGIGLTLAITHYNRYDLVQESFSKLLGHSWVEEILILDDTSTDGSYEKLYIKYAYHKKVKLIRQAQNRGMQRNKFDAVAHANTDWVILLDSDNIIDSDYIDALEKVGNSFLGVDGLISWGQKVRMLDDRTIYCPVFAKPQFDFRKYSGQTFDISNAPKAIKEDAFNMAMNCCNYVVNRNNYTAAFKENKDHVGSDTIWFNYNWLRYGGKFHFVPGMEYDHRVHPGSGFLQDADYNMKKSAEVRKLIMQL